MNGVLPVPMDKQDDSMVLTEIRVRDDTNGGLFSTST